MFGFLNPSPPIDADEFDWQIACYAWLLRELDDGDPTELVTTGVFGLQDVVAGIDRVRGGHALAQQLFARTMQLCRMEDWQGELVEGERRRESKVQSGFAIQHEHQAPLGLLSIGGGRVSIAYDLALVSVPESLVATFAHELAHYLLVGKGDPPGGPDLIEHATDCAAAYLGFGAFLANSALNFRQFSSFEESGWELQAAGYLSESALVTATALSAHLAGADMNAAEMALKAGLRGTFRKAVKAVRRRLPAGVADLQAVDLTVWK